jgi:hypothetical protein
MNAIAARRWWLKNRNWFEDALAGLGLLVFLAALYVVLP